MNADLTGLIRLQQLETAAEDARRRIADHPARTQALDARLQAAKDEVVGIKARLTAASEAAPPISTSGMKVKIRRVRTSVRDRPPR